MTQRWNLAILVGGGPAPGINSVIGAATIRARLEDVEVLGLRDGFEWIMRGNIDHVTSLDIDDVSRIHFRGGSHIGISRANPTKDPQHLENAVISLLRLNVSQLITIGGDDPAFSALKLEEEAAGRPTVEAALTTLLGDGGLAWRAYAAGHIPGACYAHLEEDLSSPVTSASGRHPLPSPNSPAEKLGRWGIDKNRQVVVYDDSFGAMAARLWWLLRWLGHDAVAVLDGGRVALTGSGPELLADPRVGELYLGGAPT